MITVTSSRQEWATKMWHASVPAAIGLLFASIQLQEFSLHSDKAPLAQSLWTAFTANALLVVAGGILAVYATVSWRLQQAKVTEATSQPVSPYNTARELHPARSDSQPTPQPHSNSAAPIQSLPQSYFASNSPTHPGFATQQGTGPEPLGAMRVGMPASTRSAIIPAVGASPSTQPVGVQGQAPSAFGLSSLLSSWGSTSSKLLQVAMGRPSFDHTHPHPSSSTDLHGRSPSSTLQGMQDSETSPDAVLQEPSALEGLGSLLHEMRDQLHAAGSVHAPFSASTGRGQDGVMLVVALLHEPATLQALAACLPQDRYFLHMPRSWAQCHQLLTQELTHGPDAVIVDALMPPTALTGGPGLLPGQQGSAACQAIRALRQVVNQPGMPVFMLGPANSADFVSAMQAGATAWLPSPLTAHMLQAQIIAQVATYHALTLCVAQRSTATLLRMLLPPPILDTLTAGIPNGAIHLSNVTAIFVEVRKLTTLMGKCAAGPVVTALHGIYSHMDMLCGKHGVLKLDCVGGIWMGVAGVKGEMEHAQSALRFARDALMLRPRMEVQGSALDLRIGMHTGACFGGIVGSTRPKFTLLGDALTTASLMGGTGWSGCVHLSAATADRVRMEAEAAAARQTGRRCSSASLAAMAAADSMAAGADGTDSVPLLVPVNVAVQGYTGPCTYLAQLGDWESVLSALERRSNVARVAADAAGSGGAGAHGAMRRSTTSRRALLAAAAAAGAAAAGKASRAGSMPSSSVTCSGSTNVPTAAGGSGSVAVTTHSGALSSENVDADVNGAGPRKGPLPAGDSTHTPAGDGIQAKTSPPLGLEQIASSSPTSSSAAAGTSSSVLDAVLSTQTGYASGRGPGSGSGSFLPPLTALAVVATAEHAKGMRAMPPQSGDAASSAPGGAFLRPPSPPETHGLDLNACDEQHMQGRAGPGPAQGSSSAHADGSMHAGKDAMLEAARMAHPLAPGGPGIVFTPASTHPHSRGGHSFLMLSTSQQSIPMALFPMATTDTGMSSAQLSNQTNTTLNLNHSGPYAVQLLSSDSSAAITHAAMHMPKPQALSNSNMGTAASAWSSSDGALTPSVAASLGTSSAPSATAIRAALGPQDTIPAPTSTQMSSIYASRAGSHTSRTGSSANTLGLSSRSSLSNHTSPGLLPTGLNTNTSGSTATGYSYNANTNSSGVTARGVYNQRRSPSQHHAAATPPAPATATATTTATTTAAPGNDVASAAGQSGSMAHSNSSPSMQSSPNSLSSGAGTSATGQGGSPHAANQGQPGTPPGAAVYGQRVAGLVAGVERSAQPYAAIQESRMSRARGSLTGGVRGNPLLHAGGGARHTMSPEEILPGILVIAASTNASDHTIISTLTADTRTASRFSNVLRTANSSQNATHAQLDELLAMARGSSVGFYQHHQYPQQTGGGAAAGGGGAMRHSTAPQMLGFGTRTDGTGHDAQASGTAGGVYGMAASGGHPLYLQTYSALRPPNAPATVLRAPVVPSQSSLPPTAASLASLRAVSGLVRSTGVTEGQGGEAVTQPGAVLTQPGAVLTVGTDGSSVANALLHAPDGAVLAVQAAVETLLQSRLSVVPEAGGAGGASANHGTKSPSTASTVDNTSAVSSGAASIVIPLHSGQGIASIAGLQAGSSVVFPMVPGAENNGSTAGFTHGRGSAGGVGGTAGLQAAGSGVGHHQMMSPSHAGVGPFLASQHSVGARSSVSAGARQASSGQTSALTHDSGMPTMQNLVLAVATANSTNNTTFNNTMMVSGSSLQQPDNPLPDLAGMLGDGNSGSVRSHAPIVPRSVNLMPFVLSDTAAAAAADPSTVSRSSASRPDSCSGSGGGGGLNGSAETPSMQQQSGWLTSGVSLGLGSLRARGSVVVPTLATVVDEPTPPASMHGSESLKTCPGDSLSGGVPVGLMGLMPPMSSPRTSSAAHGGGFMALLPLHGLRQQQPQPAAAGIRTGAHSAGSPATRTAGNAGTTSGSIRNMCRYSGLPVSGGGGNNAPAAGLAGGSAEETIVSLSSGHTSSPYAAGSSSRDSQVPTTESSVSLIASAHGSRAGTSRAIHASGQGGHGGGAVGVISALFKRMRKMKSLQRASNAGSERLLQPRSQSASAVASVKQGASFKGGSSGVETSAGSTAELDNERLRRAFSDAHATSGAAMQQVRRGTGTVSSGSGSGTGGSGSNSNSNKASSPSKRGLGSRMRELLARSS